MAAPVPPHRRRIPPALLALLLLAVLFGLAATYLAAPVVPLEPSTGGGVAPVSYQVVGEVTIGLLLVVAVVLALNRIAAGPQRWPLRLLMPFLMAFLIAIAFIVIVHALHPGGPLGTVRTVSQNGTGPPPPPPPTSGFGNGTGYPHPAPIVPGLPWWLGYAILAVALGSVLVGAFAISVTFRRDPEEPNVPGAAESVRRSIAQTLRTLESGSLSDARSAIVLLYGRLLERLASSFEDLATATAREIESECVHRLGIGPAHARTLTSLFEEARYSTHPFTEADVARARVALSETLADLDRGGGSR